MAIEYVGVEEAIRRPGARMVVVGDVPSGWGEAAKGILHIKGIEWSAVTLRYDDPHLRAWAGRLSGPVLVYDDEPPRSGWAEILLLSERLSPNEPLLPADPADRAVAFGLAHEICGEAGLGWARRLQLVHDGLNGNGGFAEPIARYLGTKYGYLADDGGGWGRRAADVLQLLTQRLEQQRRAGSPYYVGRSLTAVDVYSATFAGMFSPLPQAQCAMNSGIRAAFESRTAEIDDALAPIVLEHRDMMYRRHLELPLSL